MLDATQVLEQRRQRGEGRLTRLYVTESTGPGEGRLNEVIHTSEQILLHCLLRQQIYVGRYA